MPSKVEEYKVTVSYSDDVSATKSDYDKVAHLGFIQGAINRMAGNCFQCKAWSITLFSALLALSAQVGDTKPHSAAVLRMPICLMPVILIVFWALDAYYLRLERLFRHCYDSVRCNHVEPYDMSLDAFQKNVPCFFRTMLSRNICLFYIVLLLVCIALFFSCPMTKGYKGVN